MNEVRVACLIAKLEALKVRVLGMESFNRFRAMQGYTEGYGQDEFETIATEMENIAKELEGG